LFLLRGKYILLERHKSYYNFGFSTRLFCRLSFFPLFSILFAKIKKPYKLRINENFYYNSVVPAGFRGILYRKIISKIKGASLPKLGKTVEIIESFVVPFSPYID